MTSAANYNKQIYAWAFYDWANSAFATVIMAGFFPLFFRDYWSAGEQSQAITFHLGLANSVASLLIVISAPVLGAIADRGSFHKRFLFVFASLGVGMTGGMFWIAQGQWELAVVVYVFATIGFMGGNIFYDALIVSVATRSRYDAVSALGFGLGYLGGGLLFSLCVLMSLYPDFFGFEHTTQAVRFSFLMVAIWWATFSVPIFVTVTGPVSARRHRAGIVLGGLHQLRDTFRHIRQLRTVGLFLLAYWLYIDGVDTIVRMAIDYGRALGFGREELIVALLITQFVGFPAAIIFGRLAEWLGTKAGIFIALGVYVIATIWGSMMAAPWEFYGLAVTIGLVQGGIQSLSRAYYARLIPVDKTAEFFGFYNMLGKFAAVLGPIMVGWVGILSGNPRSGILSILVLFILGGITLSCVDTSQIR
jgi:MFS transporter, UMF1 family